MGTENTNEPASLIQDRTRTLSRNMKNCARIKEIIMALNIKNQEVEQLVSEIAELSGETKTNAVKKALVARRAQLSRDVGRDQRIQSFLRYLEEEVWSALPEGRLGVPMSKQEREAILGYGEEGV